LVRAAKVVGMSLPLRILVADDHGPFRTVLKSLLGAQGAEVVECGDGHEALKRFSELAPDWVLMDVDMPVLDGLAATRQLIAGSPGVRVVIVTQHDDEQLRAAARQAGACGFVPKDALELLTPILFPSPNFTQRSSTHPARPNL
jgi:CheY-like chemotaxis protein